LILLRWKEYERQCKVIGEKIFRYEVMWEHHEQFKPFLDDVWQAEGKATTMDQLQRKHARVSGSLDTWGRYTFGHVKREIKTFSHRVEVLRADPLCLGPSKEETRAIHRLAELYE
jgi:hypothetical protein